MASRFISRVKAPAQHIIKRGYASEHHAAQNAGQSLSEESFNAGIWKKTVAVVALGAVWYQVDQHLTSSGENKHPLTRWMASHMVSDAENDRVAVEALDNAGKLAARRLITQEAQRAPMYRMRYPESFEAASPRALTGGTHVDLSDLKIRSD
ncbi:uncharacterized protein BYT42DRAFT_562147 [Radiomyces spectabilis]|uniref:uncharacterized protein n=1 Tax=Radiomyces spectabilis TaxID=64574 RepID=UPI00221F4951|nr:uncharacterized protein BYT42DRAFT_562147 [Radiomyces spectabilis]KAI8384326.1 hypothetical protein BYT42DRAFT_562147 [Radiomyces spectabilis]